MKKNRAYDVLSLKRNCTKTEVKDAMRALLQALDPDQHPPDQRDVFQRLSQEVIDAANALYPSISSGIDSPATSQGTTICGLGASQDLLDKRAANQSLSFDSGFSDDDDDGLFDGDEDDPYDDEQGLLRVEGNTLDELTGSGVDVSVEGMDLADDCPIHFTLSILRAKTFAPEELDLASLGLDSGRLLFLTVRVTNWLKRRVFPWRARNAYVVVDREGFRYDALNPDHFGGNEALEEQYGLYRFSDWSDAQMAMPRIPFEGTLAYLLPKTVDGPLYLGTVTGDGRWGRGEYIEDDF